MLLLISFISVLLFFWIQFFCLLAAAAAKSLQSCLTLCDPVDGSPPGSAVPGISRQGHWSRLGRFISRYFILFVAGVNGVNFLISFSDFSLLVCRNASDF